jgi:hypothetical protein
MWKVPGFNSSTTKNRRKAGEWIGKDWLLIGVGCVEVFIIFFVLYLCAKLLNNNNKNECYLILSANL